MDQLNKSAGGIITADYLATLNREQENFLKQPQGSSAPPRKRSILKNMIQLIGIGLHGRVFAISNLKKIISGKTKLRIKEYQENCCQLN